MKLMRFYYHYYRDADRPKIELSFDCHLSQDFWHQRFLLGKPRYTPDKMAELKIRNSNRCEWLNLVFRCCGAYLSVAIRLRKIGNLLHGRIVDDEKDAQEWLDSVSRMRP